MIRQTLVGLFIFTSIIFSQSNSYKTYRNIHLSGGFQLGLNNGIGGHLNIKISHFADNFPLAAKISVGLSYPDVGDPMAARRIFINNNTNGVPQKSGRVYDFSLDFLYKKSVLGLRRNYFYIGPRYTSFLADFVYVGGNEDFEVTSNQWGVGIGVENYFRVISTIDLVFNFGYDYYISETLYGHDTSYNPNGQDINPRENYKFKDADDAINQPKHQLKALIGLSLSLN